MGDIAARSTEDGGILVTITADDQANPTPCEVQVELTIAGAQKLKSQLEAALVASGTPGKRSRVRRSASGNPKKPSES